MTTVTDTLGDTFSFNNKNTINGGSSAYGTNAYAQIGSTAANTISVAVALGGSQAIGGLCVELTGTSSSPFDVGAINPQASPGTGANAVTTGSVTTSVNNEFIFAWTTDSSYNSGTFSVGTCCSTIGNAGGNLNVTAEQQTLASAGAVTSTFTCNTHCGDYILTGTMTFKPFVAGASPTAPPRVIGR